MLLFLVPGRLSSIPGKAQLAGDGLREGTGGFLSTEQLCLSGLELPANKHPPDFRVRRASW